MLKFDLNEGETRQRVVLCCVAHVVLNCAVLCCVVLSCVAWCCDVLSCDCVVIILSCLVIALWLLCVVLPLPLPVPVPVPVPLSLFSYLLKHGLIHFMLRYSELFDETQTKTKDKDKDKRQRLACYLQQVGR